MQRSVALSNALKEIHSKADVMSKIVYIRPARRLGSRKDLVLAAYLLFGIREEIQQF